MLGVTLRQQRQNVAGAQTVTDVASVIFRGLRERSPDDSAGVPARPAIVGLHQQAAGLVVSHCGWPRLIEWRAEYPVRHI